MLQHRKNGQASPLKKIRNNTNYIITAATQRSNGATCPELLMADCNSGASIAISLKEWHYFICYFFNDRHETVTAS
jgi:hypothetical protein